MLAQTYSYKKFTWATDSTRMHVRPCRDCLQLGAHNANFDPIITRLSDITDAGTSSVSVFRKDNNLLRDTLLILLVAAS